MSTGTPSPLDLAASLSSLGPQLALPPEAARFEAEAAGAAAALEGAADALAELDLLLAGLTVRARLHGSIAHGRGTGSGACAVARGGLAGGTARFKVKGLKYLLLAPAPLAGPTE